MPTQGDSGILSWHEHHSKSSRFPKTGAFAMLLFFPAIVITL